MIDKNLEEQIVKAIRKAVTELPEDVVLAIRKARDRENEEVAKLQLDTMLKNIEVAKREGLPICQDTGTQTFFVEIGLDFDGRISDIRELKDVIIKAVRRATKEVPLRPNSVHPLTGKNSGDNTGDHVPHITWDFVDGDNITIHVLPKGGGGENMSALFMLNPTEGLEGAKKAIVEHIRKAGGKPCPPTVIGIGIGGGADLCMKIAKKALIRKVGERHRNKVIASIEEELIDKINDLGIGPMGMGGKTTTLDVHVEIAHRHPASYPVGIITQCWADRRADVIIKDGNIEVI